MNVRDKLRADLAAMPIGSSGIIHADGDRRRLTCNIEEIQPLACCVREISLHVESLASATIDELKNISNDLAARLTYLLEPVGPVELDTDQCVVQMRSTPPAKDDDGTSYYELLVRKGGDLVLCRYQKQPGGSRQAVAAILTQEVLVRLAGDFDAAVPA